MRTTFRFAGAIALALLSSCAEAPGAPSASGADDAVAQLGIAPTFSAAATQAYGALTASGGDITNIHIVLRDLAGGVALDTVIAFPATVQALTLDLPLRIAGNQQDFNATIELRDANGVVQFATTQRVTARDRARGGAATSIVTLEYVGPGATAKAVTVSPSGLEIPTGGSQVVVATALDASGKTVPDLAVTWKASDASIASVVATGPASALVTSKGARGPVTITATVLNGTAGSATLTVLPQPALLVVISGGGQTAPGFKVLDKPFVVELDGTDGKPIAKKIVSFRTTTTGGDVGFSTVTTDSVGRASTTMKLGQNTGTYSYEASAGTLAPVIITATATAPIVGPPTQLIPLTPVPQSYKVGQPTTLSYSAQIADAAGLSVTQAGIVITATFFTQPDGVTSSTTTASDASGVVTFSNTPVFPRAGTVTITLTSSLPTMTNLPSGTFAIVP
jgi:hypothetical protein